MKQKTLKEAVLPRNWDGFSQENWPFFEKAQKMEVIDLDELYSVIDEKELDTCSFLDEDEKFDEWFALQEDIQFSIGLYQGHKIVAFKNCGSFTFFTPGGLAPEKLPAIGHKPEHIVKFVNKEAFDIKSKDIPGMFVVHGTDLSSLQSIKEEGIRIDKMFKGNLGIAFYTTPNYKYALSNYAKLADDSDTKDQSGIVLLQIKPTAKILKDGEPKFDKIQSRMEMNDFGRYLKEEGYDGLFCPSMDAIAIHNPNAVEIISIFTTSEIANVESKKKEVGLNRN
jgi:hypothetical protein